MAVYHYSAKVIGRSSGRSAVASAAYRAGEKLYNRYEGLTYDFRRKTGVVHSEIMLPENAPRKLQNRSVLWNEVEKSERRKDAQTAREIEVALPVECSRERQLRLLESYTKANFIDLGMCADICLHDKGDGNPHAHIMLTTREIDASGFGGKRRDWNDKRLLEQWRESWAEFCNRSLEEIGSAQRVDHRSNRERHLDVEPTIHLGPSAWQMEKKGIPTDRGGINRAVCQRNADYAAEMARLRALRQELLARQPVEKPSILGQLAEARRREQAGKPPAVILPLNQTSVLERLAAARRYGEARDRKLRGDAAPEKRTEIPKAPPRPKTPPRSDLPKESLLRRLAEARRQIDEAAPARASPTAKRPDKEHSR